MSKISEMILQEVSSWDGVTVGDHRFGGTEFRVGDLRSAAALRYREIGHLDGDYQADIPFSARLRRELVASGKALLKELQFINSNI